MAKKLKLLNIEDSEFDAELLLRHLNAENYDVDFTRVDSFEVLKNALQNEKWDIVICDYSIPGLSVDEALELVKTNDPNVPFLVISGTILEEKAVELMRAGAGDYLMKDNLKRLGPAIERELQEAENRLRKMESDASLAESEKRLKLALRAAEMGVWEWNLKTDNVSGSTEFYSIWEVDESVSKFQQFTERCHPDDIDATLRRLQKSIDEREVYSGDFRIQGASGTKYVTVTALAEYDNSGNPQRVIGSIRDITDKKTTEKESREIEQRFHALASSADLVWVADGDGNISKPEISRGSFHERSLDLDDKNWWASIIHPDEQTQAIENWERSVKSRSVFEMECRIQYSDDGYRHYFIRAVPVFNDDGQIREWVGMNLDISGRKAAEEALRSSEEKLAQAQKLESVGRLAGGIAHDFNNMLTAINGYSDLALRKLERDNPLRPYLEEIRKSGERSAALTQQLLAFSRKQVLNPAVIDINQIVRETGSMLRRLINANIHFETDLANDLGAVKVDPGQLSQVLMNLIVNASDAMPAGGELRIETCNLELDERLVSFHEDATTGKYVLLQVSDTGIGIDEKIKSNIFEPFFSTKAAKGTGLGLSTVYGIVNQSGGFITVDSEPGKGATFKIFFPQVLDSRKSSKIEEGSPASSAGSERILLVEDEEMVRNLCRQVLESCGYSVVEAKDGVEALDIFETRNLNFDLLISDIVMPKMGGKELAEKINSIDPDLPVLFMSGYPDNDFVKRGVIEANVNFLQKPFTVETLTSKIRGVLDKRKMPNSLP